ncbi:MAG: hypothetical protein GX875_04260, partial [Propionibacterium sp.]|nr:hypothetical protein [Propionibacterium sp.]
AVTKGQHVEAGDTLADVDLDKIAAAGFDPTTIMVITNTKALGTITPEPAGEVVAGDVTLRVEA